MTRRPRSIEIMPALAQRTAESTDPRADTSGVASRTSSAADSRLTHGTDSRSTTANAPKPIPTDAAGLIAADEPGVRRLNANLPAAMLDDMSEEKRRSGRDITELVKLGWQLTKIALREQRRGHALAVVDADGRVVKELVIPD